MPTFPRDHTKAFVAQVRAIEYALFRPGIRIAYPCPTADRQEKVLAGLERQWAVRRVVGVTMERRGHALMFSNGSVIDVPVPSRGVSE